MKSKKIPEWVAGSNFESDSVYFDCVPKLISLFNKGDKMFDEYLESKRSHSFSKKWYKRAIEIQRQIAKLSWPYIDHSFRHNHDPLMFMNTKDRKNTELKKISKGVTPEAFYVDYAYLLSMMNLIAWYADTFNERERSIYVKKYDAYRNRMSTYLAKVDPQKLRESKSKKVTQKSVKK